MSKSDTQWEWQSLPLHGNTQNGGMDLVEFHDNLNWKQLNFRRTDKVRARESGKETLQRESFI